MMDKKDRKRLCELLTGFNVPAQYDSVGLSVYPIEDWIDDQFCGAVQSPPDDVFALDEAMLRLLDYIEIYERRIDKAKSFLKQVSDGGCKCHNTSDVAELKERIHRQATYRSDTFTNWSWCLSEKSLFDIIDEWLAEKLDK